MHLSRLLSAVCACIAFLAAANPSAALERPDVEFKVFQFPADMIPRIDGDASDWDMVPDSYVIGQDQLRDTVNKTAYDPKDLDVNVTVGWVKGLNRLYFLYETYDNYWSFARSDLHNDIFEIVVDADLSGGPLIPGLRKDMKLDPWNGYLFQGVQAQNYHTFTPAQGKIWTMVWGCQPWIAELPWSNCAYNYNFKPGGSGKLIMEFWITPFDYAPYEGPERAVVSKLVENAIIGMSWSILEYDNDIEGQTYKAFWNLSHVTQMYGNASLAVAFRLMPIEAQLRDPVEAAWSFKVIDMDRRMVAFKDESYGTITSWLWDFGDGSTSTEQNPIHQYEKPGLMNVVILTVTGTKGTARLSKVWDVAIK